MQFVITDTTKHFTLLHNATSAFLHSKLNKKALHQHAIRLRYIGLHLSWLRIMEELSEYFVHCWTQGHKLNSGSYPQKLELKRKNIFIVMTGIYNALVSKSRNIITIKVKPRIHLQAKWITVKTYIISKIAAQLPKLIMDSNTN